LSQAGMAVIDLGLVSTDAVYFASGSKQLPGVMLTASHNPPGDNGLKVMWPGAKPIGRDNGLAEIARLAQAGVVPTATQPGAVSRLDIWPQFAAYLRSLVDLTQPRRPLKVVVDAGNGVGGLVTRAVLGQAAGLTQLPIEVVELYFDPDGTFPNHPANPLVPQNLIDLQRTVIQTGAHAGLAFDGDADRCFWVDESGRPVPASAIGTMIALGEVAQMGTAGQPAVIVHNAITSKALAEMVQAAGGRTVRTPVGHALIKPVMAQQGAVFGAEHSGHYYFRDFFFADTGILTALHVLAALAASDQPMSALASQFTPYTASGEINFKVADVAGALRGVEQMLSGVVVDRLDGLTFDAWEGQGWWANLRPSNTEAALRLNVEAKQPGTMAQVRDQISHYLEGHSE
ncbi:MAG: phosphomannomutase/phosphoglucomutase, partial [Micrococcales bacterium]|nr:phosphomannomutase/phosphoglucomutase [Micrococcales bacterium]